MKLNLVINDKVSDFLDKVYSLLFLKHEEFFGNYFNSMGLHLDKEYDVLRNKIKKIKGLDSGFLDLYFESFCEYEEVSNGNVFCLATSFYKIPELFDKNSEEIVEYLSQCSKEKIQINIIQSLVYLNKVTEHIDVEEMIMDDNKIFDFLNDLHMKADCKWNVFTVLKDPKKYVDMFLRKLLEVDKDLDKALEVLHTVRESWVQQLETYEMNFSIQIIETLKGNEYIQEKNIYVFPTLIPYTAIISKDRNAVYVGLGIKVDLFFNVMKGNDDLDYITNMLKSLSDKSKFKILTLLSHDQLYANEIAEKLQLTNATISHHMRTMTIQGIVKSMRSQNRTYYYLNKEVIEDLIARMNKELLHKGE
ncbi:transcriptional regulator [Bacillus pseudomycoides]|uniref:Transcriptional regulator n=1 Tax=Bacillus pseudomycoides TaxID=64104 RepID=A0AA91VCG9_9BACI|nr:MULTISPECIES: metalloregulator ArsR/SmtB family transcription factor [Bacillus]PEB47857.1 transcriptional regulator [Bacillus sp. AFS098217]PED82678.1 transcriptional regulator [Bacillus pseudomycoides]PEU12747.1 transcriptional regulator [Bacillus sp. AFS014408]PEU13698.1 transcriptional regulator [Bacillus sp. AFS019443]PFW60117.1 transcriptional regulator [Bacillus sp. AFS075034]